MPSNNHARQFGGGGGNKFMEGLQILGAFGAGPLAAPELDPAMANAQGPNEGTGEGTKALPYKNSGRGKAANAEYFTNNLIQDKQNNFTTGRDKTLAGYQSTAAKAAVDAQHQRDLFLEGAKILSSFGMIPNDQNIGTFNEVTTPQKLQEAGYKADGDLSNARVLEGYLSTSEPQRLRDMQSTGNLTSKNLSYNNDNFLAQKNAEMEAKAAQTALIKAETFKAPYISNPISGEIIDTSKGSPKSLKEIMDSMDKSKGADQGILDKMGSFFGGGQRPLSAQGGMPTAPQGQPQIQQQVPAAGPRVMYPTDDPTIPQGMVRLPSGRLAPASLLQKK